MRTKKELFQIVANNIEKLIKEGRHGYYVKGICAVTAVLRQDEVINREEETFIDDLIYELPTIDVRGYRWEPGNLKIRQEWLESQIKDNSSDTGLSGDKS